MFASANGVIHTYLVGKTVHEIPCGTGISCRIVTFSTECGGVNATSCGCIPAWRNHSHSGYAARIDFLFHCSPRLALSRIRACEHHCAADLPHARRMRAAARGRVPHHRREAARTRGYRTRTRAHVHLAHVLLVHAHHERCRIAHIRAVRTRRAQDGEDGGPRDSRVHIDDDRGEHGQHAHADRQCPQPLLQGAHRHVHRAFPGGDGALYGGLGGDAHCHHLHCVPRAQARGHQRHGLQIDRAWRACAGFHETAARRDPRYRLWRRLWR